MRSRIGRNISENKDYIFISIHLHVSHIICAFSILEIPTLDLWSYLSDLDFEAWSKFQNKVL